MPTFDEILQIASPSIPNVETWMVIHQEDGVVYYGYGSLRYFEDLPGFDTDEMIQFPSSPGIYEHPAISEFESTLRPGLSSNDQYSFKITSNQSYIPSPSGNWSDRQIFPVTLNEFLYTTIYKTSFTQVPINQNFESRITVSIVDPSNSSQLVKFDAQIISGLLIGYSKALYDQTKNAVYSFSFGAAYVDIS